MASENELAPEKYKLFSSQHFQSHLHCNFTIQYESILARVIARAQPMSIPNDTTDIFVKLTRILKVVIVLK